MNNKDWPWRRCKCCMKVFHENEMVIITQRPVDIEQCPLCGATDGFQLRKAPLKED